MFYDRYLYWCNRIGKTPSAVALEIGLKKSSVTRWKNGGGVTDATAKKVADYFGVSIAEFLGDKKEKPTAESSELSKDIQELTTLLESLSDEKLQMVVNYVRFLASQE